MKKENDTPIRAFVGIPLDKTSNNLLSRALEPLQASPQSKHIRWVQPQNRHLTLAFLGQVPAAIGGQLMDCLHRHLREHNANTGFELKLQNIKRFPGARSLIVAAITDNPPQLQTLYQCLQKCCAQLSLAENNKPFRPHITLGRNRHKIRAAGTDNSEHRPEIVELEIVLTVDKVNFYRSALTPEGSQYTALSYLSLLPD